jgi:predicted  nucleic acid-binding Zn-ribbon protein
MKIKDAIQTIVDIQNNINKELSEIKIILAKQEAQLEYHIKRTDIAEKNLETLRKEFAPIKQHIDAIKIIIKSISVISIIIGIFVGIFKLLDYLRVIFK